MLGLRKDTSAVPILRTMMEKIDELTTGVTPRFYKQDEKIHAKNYHKPGPETYDFLVNRYGLPLVELLEVEQEIKSIKQLPASLKHPAVRRICEVDIGFEFNHESTRNGGQMYHVPLDWLCAGGWSAASFIDPQLGLYGSLLVYWSVIGYVVVGAPIIEEYLRTMGPRIYGRKLLTWIAWITEVPRGGVRAVPAAALHEWLDRQAETMSWQERAKIHGAFNLSAALLEPVTWEIIGTTLGVLAALPVIATAGFCSMFRGYTPREVLSGVSQSAVELWQCGVGVARRTVHSAADRVANAVAAVDRAGIHSAIDKCVDSPQLHSAVDRALNACESVNRAAVHSAIDRAVNAASGVAQTARGSASSVLSWATSVVKQIRKPPGGSQ